MSLERIVDDAKELINSPKGYLLATTILVGATITDILTTQTLFNDATHLAARAGIDIWKDLLAGEGGSFGKYIISTYGFEAIVSFKLLAAASVAYLGAKIPVARYASIISGTYLTYVSAQNLIVYYNLLPLIHHLTN